MEMFNQIGAMTEVLSFVPFAFIMFYFLASDTLTKKRLGVAVIVSWIVLFIMHVLRYSILYITVGFVEFPFPIIVYPGLIYGWYEIIFKRN